jgi:hypothetical protein
VALGTASLSSVLSVTLYCSLKSFVNARDGIDRLPVRLKSPIGW